MPLIFSYVSEGEYRCSWSWGRKERVSRVIQNSTKQSCWQEVRPQLVR